MIYQIDGKNVKHKPSGYFYKIVEVPGKLINFITKESEITIKDFWVKINKQWSHLTIDGNKTYINGEMI